MRTLLQFFRIPFVAILFLSLTSIPGTAQPVDWTEFPHPYVSMIVRSTIDAEKNGISRPTLHIWGEVMLETETKKSRYRVLVQKNRPSSFESPHLEYFVSQEEIVMFLHAKKTVVRVPLDALEENEKKILTEGGGFDILFAGRSYWGYGISELIENASIQTLQGGFSGRKLATVSEPYFEKELEITLNTKDFPVSIKYGHRTHTFRWVTDPTTKQPYVLRSEMIERMDGKSGSIKEMVVSFDVEDTLPASYFSYGIPTGYEVISQEELRRRIHGDSQPEFDNPLMIH